VSEIIKNTYGATPAQLKRKHMGEQLKMLVEVRNEILKQAIIHSLSPERIMRMLLSGETGKNYVKENKTKKH